MGIIYADLRLSNMGRPELEEITVNAIVDIGAIDLVVPEHIAIPRQLTDLRGCRRKQHLARYALIEAFWRGVLDGDEDAK